MSDQLPEENHELAQVLNRIKALMQHVDPAATPAFDENIPLLTEVYEGAAPTFTARQPQHVSAVEQAGRAESVAANVIPAELIDSLLTEMMPMIQATVKETVQLEMVKLERVLVTRLELELIQTLRERLQSR